MAATITISGSYATILGDWKEVTGALGLTQRVPSHKVISMQISGGQVLALYHVGRRG